MEFVAEVSLEEDEQDALEAGLLDDVDELLNEDDEATSPYPPHTTAPATFKSHRSRPSFTNPFSPQLIDGAQLATPRVSLESPSGRKIEAALPLEQGESRNSEEGDHWEEDFSDFEEPEDDDDEEEEENSVEEKPQKVTKPGMVHTISMEKRMD